MNLNSCPQCGSTLRVLASVDHSDLRIVRVICQNQKCESLWWVSYLPQNIPFGLASRPELGQHPQEDGRDPFDRDMTEPYEP